MGVIRRILGRGNPIVTSAEPGHFSWDDPLSQPRNGFCFSLNATLTGPAGREPESRAPVSKAAAKRKSRA